MGSGTQRATDDAVLRLIKLNLPSMGDTSAITADTDLWAAGMDSLDNISVMIALEDAFGIEFPDELLTEEVFASASRIAQAVRQLTKKQVAW